MKNLLLTTDDIMKVINEVRTVANVVLGIISVAVVFLAIWIGYKFMTADSDEKRKEAKSQLIYAIIGVVIAIGLLIVLNTINFAQVFGIKDAITVAPTNA